MCFGPCIEYKCGHHKHSVESACKYGPDEHGECSRGRFTVTRYRTSATPSLCINCYRRRVDDIIARYKQQIRLLDEEIDGLTEAIAIVDNRERNRELEETVSELEVQRGELIDGRYDELEEFRIQQGVWGDGGLYKGYRPFGTLSAAE